LDDDTAAFLHEWAVARAGDKSELAEALRDLVAAYCALSNLGEAAALRELLTLLSAPDDGIARQEYLLDAKLRATTGLSGKHVYKRLRSLESETGLKFAALDRRRKLLIDREDGSA
jgi:hypothetical protein